MATKKLIYQLKEVAIASIAFNTGQIPDVPANPRFIRDISFERQKRSQEEDPEMLQLREPILYKMDNNQLVCICGEMRLRAEKDRGTTTLLCKILPTKTTAEKLRAYAIKDNGHAGEWDKESLANDWQEEEVTNWIGDIKTWGAEEEEESEEQSGGEGDSDPSFVITLEYTEDDYRDVKEALKLLEGTNEDIFYKLLEEKGLMRSDG